MALTAYHAGRRPNQAQYGLAVFVETFKYNDAADLVKIDSSVPKQGDAHPDYPFMFVTDVNFVETGPQATSADITYMGCMTDDGEGNPILPPQQNESTNQIQSASSSRSSTGLVATSPVTIQYYAPTNTLNYISYGGPGTDSPDDPSTGLVVLTFTIADTTLATGHFINDLVAVFFTPIVVESSRSTEIVKGKYWSNSSSKVLTYFPFIFTVTSGPFVSLATVGTGYSVSDTLTISSGGESATITVTGVGVSNSIYTYTIGADTFTAPHNFLAASGGTGTGAKFNVLIIP